MTDRLELPLRYRRELEALLREHVPEAEVWAYGSRVSGESHPVSDLDLVLRGPSLERLGHGFSDFLEALEESNIPILIQAHDWARLPKSFHREIERDYVVIAERDDRATTRDWLRTTLGEVITLQRGFDLPKSKRIDGPFPVIASTGPLGTHEEAKVKGPGVVIGRSGSLGGGQYIESSFWPLNTTLWVKDFKGNDHRFCYYLLRSLDLAQFNVGSGVPTLNRNHVHPLPVFLPPLPEQRAIARVLGTLDDKIELNRRMNETLEEMARALFKSWFVDFDPVRAKAALKQHSALQDHSPLEGESARQGALAPSSRWGETRRTESTWAEIQRSYSKQTLEQAKALRQRQTDAEGLLWHYLRKKQLGGYKFRRQQPIGPYIVDFACMSEKLVVELDGGQHAELAAHDERRDAFLRSEGFRVLRFWNNEVFENCYGVLERMYEALRTPPPRQTEPAGSTAATPPPGGSEKTAEGRIATSGGSNWTVERARGYLAGMDSRIVDLFPDRLVDSELGEIPEGWEAQELGELANVSSGKRPGSRFPVENDEARIPLWGGNGPMGFVAAALVDFPILLTGRVGTLGSVFRITTPCWPSDNTLIVTGKSSQILNYLFFQMGKIDFNSLNRGSTQPLLTQSDLKSQLVIVPPRNILENFHDTTKLLFNSQDQRNHASVGLASQRDILMPKFVSGQFRVADSDHLSRR